MTCLFWRPGAATAVLEVKVKALEVKEITDVMQELTSGDYSDLAAVQARAWDLLQCSVVMSIIRGTAEQCESLDTCFRPNAAYMNSYLLVTGSALWSRKWQLISMI